mgnify:CR=1 FL=1
MQKGDYLLQNFAMFVHLGKTADPFHYAMKLVDLFYNELEPYSDRIGIVKRWEDIEENQKAGKMSAMLTLEEGGICKGDLSCLRDFYRLGARMMTITWNFPNELGFPNGKDESVSPARSVPDTEHGLTETGIAFVQEMERIGMIIDISHLNDAGIRDVFHYTKKPFVASHSNARALARHPRNLTDEMIRALAEKNQKKALDLYYDLLSLKEPPMRILFLSARQFNQLLLVKSLAAKGYDKAAIASRAKIAPFVAGRCMTQARSFTTDQLKTAVQDCVQAEEDVKTGKITDTLSVELLIMKYSK